jgi:hypothetical protein
LADVLNGRFACVEPRAAIHTPTQYHHQTKRVKNLPGRRTDRLTGQLLKYVADISRRMISQISTSFRDGISARRE